MLPRLLPFAAAFGLVCFLIAGGDAPRAADGPAAAADDVQDVVFFGEGRPLLIRLHVRIDGKPFRTAFRVAFDEYIKHYRSLPENQELVDIAAAVAASPFMSRETGRHG